MAERPDRQEQWAVFWCSLLSPLLYGEVSPQEAGPFLRQLAKREQNFPDGTRRKPSRATLWRKWKEYQQGGLKALIRRPRSDRGKPRQASQAMVDMAVELKKEQPLRPHKTINDFLESKFKKTIPKSTLYRHLRQRNATRIKLGVSQRKVRRRWTRDYSNALWLGDFQDGPYVLEGDGAVPTYLAAWIDCHSRYVVDARYYLRENFDVLIDSLLRAWSVHGASVELYVDNAKIYHAHALKMACLALNIRLIHRGVADPPPGGLIERFFRTGQGQFEAEVRAGDILTLPHLNRALAAWLEVSYHQQPNQETGQTPALRYEQGKRFLRHVNLQDVMEYFLKREVRTVHPDFSDVQINRLFFQVDPRLRTDKVEVRYDPYSPLESVLIYSRQGEYLRVGTRHEREGSSSQQTPAPGPGKPKHNYLDLLVQKHQQAMRQRAAGIDYQAALARADRRWPFVQFAKQLAKRLGRQGGLSAFRTDELESLQKVYHRLPGLNPNMLDVACQRATHRTIPEIVFLLQQLQHERRE